MSDLDKEELEATRNLKVNGTDKDVGSIDEAIWRCKELIKPVHINWIGGMNQSAIKILIGNLEALSDMQDSANREIKELKEYKQMYLDEVDKHVATVLIYNSLLKRIENKIKELEKLIKEAEDNEEYSYEIPLYQHDIEILQDLLKGLEDKQ